MEISPTNMMASIVYNQTSTKNSTTLEPQKTSKKSESNHVYADDKERKENEAMLYKMQISNTKLEALGEYFGSMQKALKDSGSNGMMAYRRTSNLISNETKYMETSEYQSKENSKCIVKDITDSMDESQKKLKDKKDSDKETEKDNSISKEEDSKEILSTEENTDKINESLSEKKLDSSIISDFLTIDKQNAVKNPAGKTIDISL